MTVNELLEQFRSSFNNERDKGTAFEELMIKYLELDPVYSSQLENIWMWKDFPHRDAIGDIGIDLVAKTFEDDFWAIQCKFYEEDTVVSKKDVDSFLSASSKSFFVDGCKTNFSSRIIISTTDKYGKNAEASLENQNPPVIRIGMDDLVESAIDWSQFALNKDIKLKEKYSPRPHQEEAIKDVLNGFKTHNRGKLIMACGTGKTFTSLRLVEKLLNSKGNVLFFVPSIALVNQTLTEWSAQAQEEFNALVVCSDTKVGKGDDLVDLKVPSTTDIERLKKWVEFTKNNKREMNFVFSTYQSIEMVHQMQEATGIYFDIIICDEAHRTTGVTLANEDESSFKKVHDNNYIQADKRLYMTATPRIFGDTVKGKANEANAELTSMDDESIYGPEFHNLTFSEAVKQGLLTDYKVLVLAVDENYVKKELQGLLTDENHEISLDSSVKIMGCWKGLSKQTIESNNDSFETDPIPMKRAVAFCNQIKDSKALVDTFNAIQEHVNETHEEEASSLVNIELQHVDGTFNALEKKNCISWLKENTEDNTCRILTNARCLSEGVDVPALDAVIFLNPRSSIVDIIQSVGRVMRKSEGKKYGYVLLPIGISADENPADALDNNKKYSIVWSVLQALRAHDDRFNNTINKIDLNKHKPKQIGIVGIGENKKEDNDDGYASGKKDNGNKPSFYQPTLNFEELDKWKEKIYAKIVKKVGSRRYWESWANDIADISKRHKERIQLLLDKHDTKIDTVFHDFVKGLQTNLNESITDKDAIDMLSQHLITKPVFDALFDKYEFVKNNPVSQTMQQMMDILDRQTLEEEKVKLGKFYQSVKERAEGIDNSEAKQEIILELYQKFFKKALPKESDMLGIVYTPVQCVDFIIRSVEKVLNIEFGKSLSDRGVHIIDGFTGTGTFIVQLLRSGLIKKEDLLYKYTNDIHANEIVLLAYYIAAINIEETYHELSGNHEYIPFDGIVLTDTFQLYEDCEEDEITQLINEEILPKNNKRAKKQRELPITVCIGNPPYSAKQKSANDNSQNVKYEKLDYEISQTFAKDIKVRNINSIYDSYIRAFRWAMDRIKINGVVGFITNSSFIDSVTLSGFRKTLLTELTSVYVINMRGAIRGKSKEDSAREGQNVFDIMTGVAITILVKNSKKENDNFIHYMDVGDYLSRVDKLNIIEKYQNIMNIKWKHLVPDEYNDWINKRNNSFSNFIPMGCKDKNSDKKTIFVPFYSRGISTARDSWVYNSSVNKLKNNIKDTIQYYNNQVNEGQTQDSLVMDTTKFSWNRGTLNDLKKRKVYNYDDVEFVDAMYRPFYKQHLAYYNPLNDMQYQLNKLFPMELKNEEIINFTICVCGISSTKDFSCFITKELPDLNLLSAGAQCFPRYWYEEMPKDSLFGEGKNNYIRNDGITDYISNYVHEKYKTLYITKDDIFYYIYGILHSKDYRAKFNQDLKKELPRVPFVEKYEDFIKFVNSGKMLAKLHTNYEKIEKYGKVDISYSLDAPVDEIELYKVNKMKFGKKKDISIIEYNDYITISNIPIRAYEYKINGYSAIEWILKTYEKKTDKKSLILNDPNDWCEEVGDPKYIFNLLLSIINLSIQTVDIIESLPKLNFD